MEFVEFPKIPRLRRDVIVTEKIDGTNGQIVFEEDGSMLVGSRTRWITPGKNTDNAGFAAWATEHKQRLFELLGPGQHFGEWWGKGIQRGYGLDEKRFSLFNVTRWHDTWDNEIGLHTVPLLYVGTFDTEIINNLVSTLELNGSRAAPGFSRPEGVVVYHTASKTLFKQTIEKDEAPKSKVG